MTYLVFDLPAVVRQASRVDVRDIMPRHSPYSIRLSQAEKSDLETQARKYTAPYYSVIRAKIVLLAAQGRPNDEIAASLSVPRQLVSKWRKRFFEKGAAGLEDEPRAGRPVTVAPRADRAVQRSGR
jgi:hypothetical protein